MTSHADIILEIHEYLLEIPLGDVLWSLFIEIKQVISYLIFGLLLVDVVASGSLLAEPEVVVGAFYRNPGSFTSCSLLLYRLFLVLSCQCVRERMLILLLLWRLRVPIHTSDLINEVYLLWHMRVLLEA